MYKNLHYKTTGEDHAEHRKGHDLTEQMIWVPEKLNMLNFQN